MEPREPIYYKRLLEAIEMDDDDADDRLSKAVIRVMKSGVKPPSWFSPDVNFKIIDHYMSCDIPMDMKVIVDGSEQHIDGVTIYVQMTSPTINPWPRLKVSFSLPPSYADAVKWKNALSGAMGNVFGTDLIDLSYTAMNSLENTIDFSSNILRFAINSQLHRFEPILRWGYETGGVGSMKAAILEVGKI